MIAALLSMIRRLLGRRLPSESPLPFRLWYGAGHGAQQGRWVMYFQARPGGRCWAYALSQRHSPHARSSN